MTRRLALLAASLAMVLLLLGYGLATTDEGPAPLSDLVGTGDTGADPDTVGIHAPHWEKAYAGTGNRSYDFDGDGLAASGECANCHMEAGGGTGPEANHRPPLHPLRLHANDTGNWFHDDDAHAGPDVTQPPQPAGFTINGSDLDCGDCHTPTNTSTYPFDTASTGDPHAVHRDAIEREGCDRCHADAETTFTGAVTFTQANASPGTHNISTPINMTRVHDGAFLSTRTEANYTRTAGSLSRGGTGWAVYNRTETDRATRRGCGDCHDQYHAEQGVTGVPLTFSFDPTSRKGPETLAGDSESFGVNASGYRTCGDCHTLDIHAVHTDGAILYTLDFEDANSTAAVPDDLLGSETCDQCHSQNVGGTDLSHSEFFQRRGLGGTAADSNDRLPDIPSRLDDLVGTPGENDCGFCHVT